MFPSPLAPGRTRTALGVLAGSVAAALAAFATRLLQARVLGPEEVGRLSIAISWAVAVGGVASLGMASALAQQVARRLTARDEEGARAAGRFGVRLGLGTGLLGTLGLVGVGGVVAEWSGRPDLRRALWAAAPIAAALPVGLAALGAIRGWGDARGRIVVRDLLGGALRLTGVAAALVAAGAQTTAVVLTGGFAAGTVAAEAAVVWYARHRFLRSPPGASDAESDTGPARTPAAPVEPTPTPAERLRALRPFALSSLLHQVLWNADLLVLGAVAPPAAVGLYVVARGTERVLEMASESAAYRFLPEASAVAAHSGAAALGQSFFAARRLVLGLLAPGLAVCLFAPREALVGLFGAPYGDAALPLRILVLGLLVSLVAGYNDRALVALGAAGQVTRGQIMGAAGGLLVTVVAAPRLGAVGAALGWCVMVVVQNVWWSSRLSRLAAVHSHRGGILTQAAVALVPAAAAAALVQSVTEEGLVIFLAVLAAGSLSGLALLVAPAIRGLDDVAGREP